MVEQGRRVTDAGEQAALDLLTKGWDGFFAGHGRGLLETALPAWLGMQRWFGAKTRAVTELRVVEWVELPIAAAGGILPAGSVPPASTLGDALLLVELRYSDGANGSRDRYQVPLAYASGDAAGVLQSESPKSIVLTVNTPTGKAVFHDATVRGEFRDGLLALIERQGSLPVESVKSASEHVAATLVAAHEGRPLHEVGSDETVGIAAAIESRHSIEAEDVAPGFVGHMPGASGGEPAAAMVHPHTGAELRGLRSDAYAAVRGTGVLGSRLGSAEQSNTNVIYGQQMIMKVFRRLQVGLNPDVEIGRFLTEVAGFARIAPFLGELMLAERDGRTTTLAMLQGLVANVGDGWEWTLKHLAGFYQATALADAEDVSAGVRGLAGEYLKAAAALGSTTAAMHLALATPTDDAAFAAEAFTTADLELDARRVETQIVAALDALEERRTALSGDAAEQAEAVLGQRAQLLERAGLIAAAKPAGQRIRIHGDYHLGQVLRTEDDFVLLDFEGEPARSLDERRRKQSPLRDVAGMLRSFSYAAYAGLDACAPELRAGLAVWARAWEAAACGEFLRAYFAAAGADATLLPERAQAQTMLNAYLLEKALYELLYELNNRPTWVGIPLAGILALPAA